jgi:hypothetical protein
MGDEQREPAVREQLVLEAQTLTARIRAQGEQASRLRDLAARIEEQTARDRQALLDLEGLLGESAQLVIDDFDRRLGGERLERVAVRLLRGRLGERAEIHYRQWFDLIREEGYEVTGRNPLGTFLSLLSRSSRVESAGPRTGRYRLRQVA